MFNLTNALLGAILVFVICIYRSLSHFKRELFRMTLGAIKNYAEIEKCRSEWRQYMANLSHFNSLAIRHTLNALRPYVISIMDNAVQREDFKEAQTCKEMLKQMDELIQKPL